jgi:hypothetical protein
MADLAGDRPGDPAGEPEPESSGHYWMPLAAHLGGRAVPVAVVNPLAAKYFAKSRLARTKSGPADAGSLAEMAMRDAPPAREPLAGVELRQAPRFAMTLVTEQARVCQPLIRLDDPTCRTARAVLRIAPTASVATGRRPGTLADANRGPRAPAPGRGEGGAPPGRGGGIDRGAPARARGGVRGRPAARSVRPARAPDRAGGCAHRVAPRWRSGAPAADDPGRRLGDLRRVHVGDRRHLALRQVRPAPGLRRRPPRRAELRPEGR